MTLRSGVRQKRVRKLFAFRITARLHLHKRINAAFLSSFTASDRSKDTNVIRVVPLGYLQYQLPDYSQTLGFASATKNIHARWTYLLL